MNKKFVFVLLLASVVLVSGCIKSQTTPTTSNLQPNNCPMYELVDCMQDPNGVRYSKVNVVDSSTNCIIKQECVIPNKTSNLQPNNCPMYELVDCIRGYNKTQVIDPISGCVIEERCIK